MILVDVNRITHKNTNDLVAMIIQVRWVKLLMLGMHHRNVQAYVCCLYFLSVHSLFGVHENDVNQPGKTLL